MKKLELALDIGDRLLLSGGATDHQRDGPQSSREGPAPSCSSDTESAQRRNAPSAIAGVDAPVSACCSNGWMVSAPAGADLAIAKARTAARLQRPTAEIEEQTLNQGRTAFVTGPIHGALPRPACRYE